MTPRRQPLQFGLRSLLWLVLLAASVGAITDAAPDPLVLAVGAASFIGVAAACFLIDFMARF